MCCEGKEVDFKELKSPEMEALQKALFPGIISLLQGGPQMPPPDMPINAQNDMGFLGGMNQFWEMSGMPGQYQAQQAPQFWNPAWTPNWGNFPGYGGGDYRNINRPDDNNREGSDEGEDRSTNPSKRIEKRPPKQI